MWLTAEYHEERVVADAVSELIGAGFDRDAIEIFGTKPPEMALAVLDRPSRASLIAVLAALTNGCLATAFVYYTQHNYPLVTGGMPLFSPWATGVVTYEMIMAGAMAGVILAFLWESGLLRRHGPAPPRLKDGSFFVRLRCPGENCATAAERLTRTGAVAVATEEESQ
jgi:hypothetical protein